MKEVVIRSDEDLSLWRKALSVYINLYKLRVFKKGSTVYKRMIEIVNGIFNYEPYTV